MRGELVLSPHPAEDSAHVFAHPVENRQEPQAQPSDWHLREIAAFVGDLKTMPSLI